MNKRPLLVISAVVGILSLWHVVVCSVQAYALDRAASRVYLAAQHAGTSVSENLETQIGLVLLNPAAQGVRIESTPERQISFSYLMSDFPPLTPADVALNFIVPISCMLILVVCIIPCNLKKWHRKEQSRDVDTSSLTDTE